MAGPVAEQRVTVPLSLMRWESLAFLHWPFPPATIQRLLPPGLEVDTYDGRAWVGVTPFVMTGVRMPGVPPLPGLSTFPETNVRTYARARDGSDGLWFLSLDTTRSASLLVRAAIGVPYCWSRMRVTRRHGEVCYSTLRRRAPRDGACSTISVVGGEPLAPGEFDHWLTGRWRAFSRAGGRLWSTPVEHPPWPLHRARTGVVDLHLFPPVGLPAPTGPPRVHWSPGVDVRLGRPRPIR